MSGLIMAALMDSLVTHLGPISDPHGQTQCMKLTNVYGPQDSAAIPSVTHAGLILT